MAKQFIVIRKLPFLFFIICGCCSSQGYGALLTIEPGKESVSGTTSTSEETQPLKPLINTSVHKNLKNKGKGILTESVSNINFEEYKLKTGELIKVSHH